MIRNCEKLPAQAQDHFIVQEYLDKPFLMEGYKFDLRIYILVTSCDPLRIFLYNDGLVRMGTEKYHTPNEANLVSVKYTHGDAHTHRHIHTHTLTEIHTQYKGHMVPLSDAAHDCQPVTVSGNRVTMALLPCRQGYLVFLFEMLPIYKWHWS